MCRLCNSTTSATADGATTAVSFMTDSPFKAVDGPGATLGQMIVPGAAVHTSGDAVGSDKTLFCNMTFDSGEE